MFWALPTACKLQMLRCSWRTCSVSDLRMSLTDFTRFLSKTFCETNVRMFDCDSDWKFFRFYSRPCVPGAVFGWRALCVHLTCLTWRATEVIESSPFDTEALDWCQVTGKPLAFLCLLPLSRIQCWHPFGKPICRGHSDQAYVNHFLKDMLAPKTFHPDIRSSFVVVVLKIMSKMTFFFRVALRWWQTGCFVILF